MNVDLTASEEAYKEITIITVIPLVVGTQWPEELRENSSQRVQFYRSVALTLPRDSDPFYQKDPGTNK